MRLIFAMSLAAVFAAPTPYATSQQTHVSVPPPAHEYRWTGSWAAAPVAAPAAVSASIGTDGATYRDIVHLSLGGAALRLHISNEFGPTQLTVASVHVAIGAGADRTQPGTDRAVTFGGAATVIIPAGAAIVSDPVAMPVPHFADLAVSLFVPAQTGVALTFHSLALSSNYIAAGDAASAPAMEAATKVSNWYLLKGVDVDAGAGGGSVVVLGASQSEGFHSTPDKNARWTDVLAARMQASPATSHLGVLNEGISGNRLLHDGTGPNGLARMDRDVLAQAGAKYLIVALGTNDIGHTFSQPKPGEAVTAEQMEWGLRQVIERAHARGIKVFGTTYLPFGGHAYYTPESDRMRQAVNAFVRSSGVFDGVIDFDKVVRDPARPEAMLPAYDSGDHLHPNDAGYKAMGDSIDLKLFQR
jgi:lysophospholipase L1-like esterase